MADQKFSLFYDCYEAYKDLAVRATGKAKNMPDPTKLPAQAKLKWNTLSGIVRYKHNMTSADYYGLHLFAYLYNPNDVGYETLGMLPAVHMCIGYYKEFLADNAQDIERLGLVPTLYDQAPEVSTASVHTDDAFYREMQEASFGAFARV